MDFFKKIEENPYQDLYWNIPEGQKRGKIAIVGGNIQSFRTPAKVAEFLLKNYPMEMVKVVLPESLKPKLPPLPDAIFLKDVAGGSIADSAGLSRIIEEVDYSLIVGDLSKNSVTKKAVATACKNTKNPLVITRDAIDLIANEKTEQLLMRPNFTVIGSLVQWQKIFKDVYYPKILMVSQSLVQVAEAFHKFTLSYPVQIVTLHEGQIIVAKNGQIVVVPLVKTSYSVLTIWNGELASRITALNLYNPGKYIESTIAALFQ